MAVISELEIRLLADVARLRQDMERARQTVDTTMSRISASVSGAMKMFAGLATAVSLVQLGSLVKNSIDAVDALNDMSARTKIAIEDLAGLAYAAKLGDTSLDGVAGAISKLAMNIGKDSEKFRQLGITASDPLEAFKQLADIFKEIKDPQQRAAFGAEALGKSWQEAAVLLEGGSQGIAALIERGKELAGVTEQMAADAGAFNDQLDTLGFYAQGVGTRIAADLLPMLTLLVGDLTATGDRATSSADLFKPLNEALRALVIFGGNVGFVLKGLGTEIGVWAAQIGQYYSAVFQFATLDFKGGVATLKAAFGEGGIGDQAAADAEKAREAFDAWEKRWTEVGAAAQSGATVAKDAGDAIADALIASATSIKVSAFLNAGDIAAAQKKTAAEYAASVKKANEFVDAMKAEALQVGLTTDQVKMMAAASAAAKAPTADLRMEIMSTALALDIAVKAGAAKVEADKAEAESAAGVKAAIAALNDERNSAYAAAINEAAANEKLIANFGLSTSAIEANELALMKNRLAQSAALELGADEIAQLERMIEVKGRNVAATSRLADLQDAQKSADSLKTFLDTDKAQSFGDALRDAFNGAGSSIVRMANAMRDFGKVSQETETRRGEAANKYMNGLSTEAQYTKDLIAIDKKQANDKLGSYGDMAGAAASFFDKQSSGYKVLSGVSEAFHVAQLAMNLASIAPAIAAGAAQMFAQSGWGGFAGVAAMIGVMAALGASTGGGGGGPSAKDRQAAAGTGSVFGDSSAKSDSIGRSIELVANNSNIELTHTAGMLASLKAIENSISGLGNLLIRGSGLSGDIAADVKGSAQATFDSVFGPGSLGEKITGGLVGKVVGSIFGGKVSTIDTGVTANAATLAAIAAGGLNAQQYSDTKKSGGWFSSDKFSTTTTDLGAEANDQFAKVILSLSAGIKTAAELLGVGGDAFTQRLNSFVVDIGKISLKDLKGEEIQEALETVFSKLGDDMAQFGVGGLEKFQQVGEGYFETLTRIATNYANLNSIMESIGETLGATGMSSIEARERLIDLTGGIDQLASQTSSFASNFLTQAEQLAPVQKYVTDQLASMGLQSLDTRDKFKDYTLDLVSSGAVATEAGAKQYAALLALSEAFAKTHAATVDLTKSEQAIADERADLQGQLDELTMTQAQLAAKARAAIDAHNLALYDQVLAAQAAKDATQSLLEDVSEAYSDLQTAIGAEKAALKTSYDKMIAGIQAGIADVTASVTKLKSLSQSLHSTLDSIRVASGDEAVDRAAAQAQVAAALAIAKAGGPLPGAESLKNALAALSKDPSDQFATYLDYQRDAYQTMGNLAALADLTDDQLSTEELALEVLQKQKDLAQMTYDAEVLRLDGILASQQAQVDLLNGISTSLISLPDALAAIAKAIGSAQQNPTVGTDALTGLYKDLLGRAPDAAGLKFWQDALASGNSLDHIKNQFLTSPEYLASHLPGFAAGGNHFGGARIVGEYGPEIEVTGPSRIFNASQTASMLRGGDNSELLAELRQQRWENAELRSMLESHLYAIAKNTLNTADSLDGAVNGETPLATKEVEEAA